MISTLHRKCISRGIALQLCAPLIAEHLQSFEECHSVPGDEDGSSFDAEERRIWKRLHRAHEALVRLGMLTPGKFKKRPARVRKALA